MKKTLLLALGLGTALAASAASPNYLQEVKSNCAEVNRQKEKEVIEIGEYYD